MRLPLLSRLRGRPRSRGQSIVELALIAPVLILMLLITIDFGRLFASYVTLTNTARVAANFGATSPGAFTGSTTTALYDATVGQESQSLTCDLQPDASGNNPPAPIFPNGKGLNATSVVSMTCDFTLLTPLVSGFFGGPLPLSAEAEFPIRTGAITNIGGSTTLPPPGAAVAAFDFVAVSGGSIDGSGNVTGVGPVTVNVNNASQNAQTHQWQWGDGSPDEFEPVPIAHTFSSPGTYTVRLTVSNTSGTSTRSRTVTVSPAPEPVPVAGFYGTPVSSGYAVGGGSGGALIQGVRPLRIDFTNTTTDGVAYAWEFGDGQTSTAVSPQHQYSNIGVFTVTLTVVDPEGTSPIIRNSYVTVGCQVPNFANTSTSAARSTWEGASFSGSIRYKQENASGNGSQNPPSLPRNIVHQTLAGGTFFAPTKNGSNPWRCDNDILVEYTP